MAPPRWIADEMLGRLARYLRFVGADTVYAKGVSDDTILARAAQDDRIVLTRDRELAHRAPRALWIPSSEIGAQWRAVRAAWPVLGTVPTFERCSLCDGRLRTYRPGETPDRESGLPRDRAEQGLAIWACAECGHLYWEGTHTARIRERLAEWTAEAAP